MSSDFDPLTMFTVIGTRYPELGCDECGDRICDIEDGNSLSELAGLADQHWQMKHQGVNDTSWRTIDVGTGEFRDATPEETLAMQAFNYYYVDSPRDTD